MCIRNITYRFREATYVRSNLSNTKKNSKTKILEIEFRPYLVNTLKAFIAAYPPL